MDPTLENFKTKALEYAVPVLYKIGGALLLWIFGRMAISAINRLIHNALERRKLEPTLIRYVDSMANVSLTILLLIALLGVFGVETTSFAAVLAAAGIAIGTAWSGLCSPTSPPVCSSSSCAPSASAITSRPAA